MELGLLGALLGGVLTLLSPCSVMLLPAFFSYAFTSPGAMLTRTGVFYLGLITTLVPLGVLAGTLGAFVNAHREGFVLVASIVIIVLGAMLLLGIPMPFMRGREGGGGTTALSVYALGTVYGLAGVCAGPLLGAALTMAAVSGNALLGGVTLLVFAAGMAVPLLVLSLLWTRLPFVRRIVRPREVRVGRWRSTWSSIVGGALTIGIGVFMLATRGTTSLGGALGASDQMRLEGWVLEQSRSVPDALVVGIALAVAASALWWSRRRARRDDAPAGPESPRSTASRRAR
ncbi:cytochrome c biogenesis CcdA family protein [Leucobacter chromiiresistens]|uniref:Cytochrome c biogenesis protein CcdA n=1 Tax=Leucobacter chromiiresistens TaxID=1079994 RepID=A0A1H0YAN7_9MICO|nr:cytochrome c biogenesis CcdA family protein [Leucobacter chromiiresistens]SDQ12187.1 Cytochrome c biogenesis protein CcdA [Leucobacter chromiiresistens]